MKIDGVSWVMEIYLKDNWHPWDSSFVMDEVDSLREEFEEWARKSPGVPRRIKAYVRYSDLREQQQAEERTIAWAEGPEPKWPKTPNSY